MALKQIAVVNWKTTAGAALTAIGLGFVLYAAPKLMGADVSLSQLINNPEFMAAMGSLMTGLGGVIVGLMSRDFNKSSEASGIVDPEEDVSPSTEAKIATRFGDK